MILPFSPPVILTSALLAFAGVTYAAEFRQDFSVVSSLKELTGSGDGQFDFVGKAGEAAQLSVVDSAFQVDVAYDPENLELQNSGVRLTRLTALDAEAEFLIVRCRLEIIPTLWSQPGQSVFNVVVGQNFRASPFQPARKARADEGPTFTAVSLSAARGSGSFYFFSDQKENSEPFDVDPDADNRFVLPLVFAFNSGSAPVKFDSPAGKAAVAPGTFSVWVGDDLVWGGVRSQNPQTRLSNFSFGLGRGTDASAEDGATAEGTFRLADIQITTEPR